MKPMPGTVVDPEIIIHTPNQPLATIYTNTHNWDGGNRCLTMGSAVARLPLPPDLWIASTNGSNPGKCSSLRVVSWRTSGSFMCHVVQVA
jgi:hypothetical protein